MSERKHGAYLSLVEEGTLSARNNARSVPRRYKTFWTWFYCVGASILLLNLLMIIRRCCDASSRQLFAIGSANATLGFGAIYAVSKKDSPRRPVLERSASLTGLDIKIPGQPVWTDSDIEGVRAIENSTLGLGSALAWLGHLNALKRFLDSPYETALIVEDDVDYDTHIRTEQIPSTAYAIRELLGSQNQSQYYYGHPSLWDILWLGHCGDFFDADRAAQLSPIKIFTDNSLPIFEDLHPWTQVFLEGIGADDDQQRLVHRSVNPLCTFGYAVTRQAAHRLVHEFAGREPSRSLEQPCSAFDVRMLEACRDAGFSCITVTPELFHHTAAPSEIAAVTDETYDDSLDLLEEEMTPNIRCSARSDLWWSNPRRPYDFPRLKARGETMSSIAQKPGECYLETL